MVPDWLKGYFPKPGKSLPVWRTEVLIPFVLERDCVCWVSECFVTPMDVHEGIVTRGDVQGWPNKNRVIIHNPINCVGLCKEHHKYAPSRKEILIWMVNEYGLWVLDWFEKLPFKHSPISGLITDVRGNYV